MSAVGRNPNLANRVRLAKSPWRAGETLNGHCEAISALVVVLLRTRSTADFEPREAATGLVRFVADPDGPCTEFPMVVLDEAVARANADDLTADVFASLLELSKSSRDDVLRQRLDELVRVVAERAQSESMLAMLAEAALARRDQTEP